MKIRTFLISVGVTAAVAGGSIYAMKQIAVRNKKPVAVMPVANADIAIQWGWDDEDEGSMYGNIISKDTQNVSLNLGSGASLQSVNVKTGDHVKTGDILMQYNVEKEELTREAKDLSLQLEKLSLTRMENELAELRNKYPGMFADLEQQEKTAAEDDEDPDANAEQMQLQDGAASVEAEADDDALEVPGILQDGTAEVSKGSDGLLEETSVGTSALSNDRNSSRTQSGNAKGTVSSKQGSGKTRKKKASLESLLEDPNADELYEALLLGTMEDFLAGSLTVQEDADQSLLEDGEPMSEEILEDGFTDDSLPAAEGLLSDAFEDSNNGLSDQRLLLSREETAGDGILLVEDAFQASGLSGETPGLSGADQDASGIPAADPDLLDDGSLDVNDTISSIGGIGAALSENEDVSDLIPETELNAESQAVNEENALANLGAELILDEQMPGADDITDPDGMAEAHLKEDEAADILSDDSVAEQLDENAGSDSQPAEGSAPADVLEEDSQDLPEGGEGTGTAAEEEIPSGIVDENGADQDSGQDSSQDSGDEDDQVLNENQNVAPEDAVDVPDVESFLDNTDEDSEKTETLNEEEEEEFSTELPEEDPDSSSGEISTTAQDIRSEMKDFFILVNLLTRQFSENGASSLKKDDLDQAKKIYEEKLSREEKTKPFLDAFGVQRSVSLFLPGANTLKSLLELERSSDDFSAADTLKSLHQGYANYLYYKLSYHMYQLQASLGTNASKISHDMAQAFEADIREAAETYYQLYFFWKYLKESVPELSQTSSLYAPLQESYLDELRQILLSHSAGPKDQVSEEQLMAYPLLGKGMGGYLSQLVYLFMNDAILEPLKPDEEMFTEDSTEDYDDYGDDGDDERTAQELREDFLDKLMEIRSERVEIRKAQLELKKAEDAIAKRTIRASLDGVVRNAGTLQDATSSKNKFIVVSGAMGMYAVGTINEMKRDTIHVGDIVKGTCDETGNEFTAVISEIMDYPTTNDEDFYDFSMDVSNTNSSKYTFYAYIEDTDGLEEGSATMKFEKEASDSKGIMLMDVLVRSEEDGSSYVYVRGDDNTLKKQEVTVGKATLYGMGKSVTSGLTYDDYIAFPADNISEGDPTETVDYLEGIY